MTGQFVDYSQPNVYVFTAKPPLPDSELSPKMITDDIGVLCTYPSVGEVWPKNTSSRKTPLRSPVSSPVSAPPHYSTPLSGDEPVTGGSSAAASSPEMYDDSFEPYAIGYTTADVAKYAAGSVHRRAGRHVGVILPVARGTAPPPGWEPLPHPREELSPRASAAVRAFADNGLLSPTARRRQAWLAACATTKDKAHAAAKDAKKKKKKKKQASLTASGGSTETAMITELHDDGASKIQAAERGRAARALVRRMRKEAAEAGDRKVRYMPKMKPVAKLHWQDRDKKLVAPATKIQAAIRGRLTRQAVARKRQEDEEERQRLLHESGPAAAPAANELNLFWDSHGNPLPAWLDSLPCLDFPLSELKEIRALRKISTVTDWVPRCNGDYYVATCDAGGLGRKARPFRLLLRAWEPSKFQPPELAETRTPEPPAPTLSTAEKPRAGTPTAEPSTPEAPPRADGESAGGEGEEGEASPVTTGAATGSGSGGSSGGEDAQTSAPSGSGASRSSHATSAVGSPTESAASVAPAKVRYGHIIEVVAVLNHPDALSKAKEKEKDEESDRKKTKPIKVVRARRPKALATDAPDQRTFRGRHDRDLGLTSYRGGPDGRGPHHLL